MSDYIPTMAELKAKYRVNPGIPATLPVRDGAIRLEQQIWKHTSKGMVQIIAASEWDAIQFYPEHYQIAGPTE